MFGSHMVTLLKMAAVSSSRSWEIFDKLCLGDTVDAKKDHLLYYIRFLEEEKPLRDKPFQRELTQKLKVLLTTAENKWMAICLLPHVIKDCDAETLLQNGLFWLRSLLQFLSSKPSPKVRDLSLKSISVLLGLAVEFDDLSREISLNFIHPIFTNLLAFTKSNLEDSITAINVFRQCIRFYPGPSGRFRSQVENICLRLIDSEIISHQNAACSCLAMLPRCGSAGEKGMKFAEFWSKYSKLIFNTISQLWKELILTGETEKQKGNREKILKMSIISAAEPEHSKLISRRICALFAVFEKMISSDFPNVVKINLERTLSFCCAIIERDIDFGNHSIDVICINRSIPHIWQAVLSFLNALIAQITSIMLPYEYTVLKIGIKVLSLGNSNKYDGYYKPFPKLKVQVYQLLNTWVSAVSPLLCESVAKITQHALDDIKPIAINNKLKKSQTDDKTRKISQSKKLQKELTKEEMAGKKADTSVNSDIAFAALKFLQSFISSSGPMLSSNLVSKIQEEIISIGFSIADSTNQLIGSFSSPYGCTKCRLELYKCIFQFFNLYHHELPTPMSLMMNIFKMGLTDPAMEVSSYCKEILSLSDKVLRPSVPAIREYDVDSISVFNQSTFDNKTDVLRGKSYVFGAFSDEDEESEEIIGALPHNDVPLPSSVGYGNIEKLTPRATQEPSTLQELHQVNQEPKNISELNLARGEQTRELTLIGSSETGFDKDVSSADIAIEITNHISSIDDTAPKLNKHTHGITKILSKPLVKGILENNSESDIEMETNAKRPRFENDMDSNRCASADNTNKDESAMEIEKRIFDAEQEAAISKVEVSDVDEEELDTTELAFDADDKLSKNNSATDECIVIDSDEETGMILNSFVNSYPDSE